MIKTKNNTKITVHRISDCFPIFFAVNLNPRTLPRSSTVRSLSLSLSLTHTLSLSLLFSSLFLFFSSSFFFFLPFFFLFHFFYFRSQQNFVMEVPGSSGQSQFVWTGDRWQQAPDGIKGHEGQYWFVVYLFLVFFFFFFFFLSFSFFL